MGKVLGKYTWPSTKDLITGHVHKSQAKQKEMSKSREDNFQESETERCAAWKEGGKGEICLFINKLRDQSKTDIFQGVHRKEVTNNPETGD